MTGFKRTEAFFDSLFEMIGNILLALIRRLAPFAVPAAPAFFLAHAVAAAASQIEAGSVWGLIVGIVAALGLESAGILGAHLAVQFYGQRDAKWQIAAAATAVYLLIGVSTIWLLDGTNLDAKAVGTAMFLIAGIVYLLLGLSASAQAAETTVSQAAVYQDQLAAAQRNRQHERDMAQLRHEQQMEHERLAAQERIKLAEIEARSIARSVTRSDNGQKPSSWPSDYRLLSEQQKTAITKLTSGQLQELAGISASTARRWKRQVSKK